MNCKRAERLMQQRLDHAISAAELSALEEHLNYHELIRRADGAEPQIAQLDLLIPVKCRNEG